MGSVQPGVVAPTQIPPSTPPQRAPLDIPRLSPSRMPDQALTSQSLRSGHFHLDTFSPVNQNGSFEFDRVIKGGKVSRRVRKKGVWKSSWKEAYLVLRPNLLSVYKEADETQLRASITLSDVTAVARVKKSKTDNVFGVFTPAKNYHFATSTERELSDWVTLLRIESRTGEDDELDLPLPDMRQQDNSESTDLSADEDVDLPGSPEGPHWALRGNKSRGGSLSGRQSGDLRLGSTREYAGVGVSEAFNTSQSDLSDGVNASLSSSIPGMGPVGMSSKPKTLLSPIPDASPVPPRSPVAPMAVGRPSFQRSTSQISVAALTQGNDKAIDPNKIVRQGHLHALKTVSGMRQWKSVWAVLRSNSLTVYKSSSEYKPLKVIPISDLIEAAEVDPISKSKHFCFQLIGVEKTLKYAVEDESELEGWLGALKSVLARRTRSRGLSSGQTPVNLNVASIQTHNSNATMIHNQVTTSTPQTTGSGHIPQTQITRPQSSLDGIVEGTEEMAVR